MLVSLVAEVEATAAGAVPLTHGEAMQSELFRQMHRIDPDLTGEVHGSSDGQPRPYTVSPLQPDTPHPQRGMLHFRTGERCWFRLTGLDANTSQLLLALSEHAHGWRLGGGSFGSEFAVRRWYIGPTEHAWAGLISLEDLGQAAWQACQSEPDRIVLRFHTPTCFELSTGAAWGNWMPLPVPKLVFGGLLNRLAAFGAELGAPPSQAELLDGHVALGQFRELESHMLHFQRRNRRRAGFTGECEFLLDRELPEPKRLWLHLAACLAFYSGVGAGTSWGMGQARREPASEFVYRGTSAG